MPMPEPTLIVCTKHRLFGEQPSCAARGSKILHKKLMPLANMVGVAVDTVPCLGECELGPNIKLAPYGDIYHHVSEADLPNLVVAALAASTRKTEP